MQSIAGNQASFAQGPPRSGIPAIQRKCACGGTAGLDGECSECREKRLTGLTPPLVQTKLKMGQPGDMYEQEADRIAEQVMRVPESSVQRQNDLDEEQEEEIVQTKPVSVQMTPVIQRQVELEEEEEPIPEEEEEEEFFQAKPVPGQFPEVTPDLVARIQSLRGGGQPLPESTRAFFESRFGYDFSPVRVHTDARAAKLGQAMNARAYTVGQDVVFSAGQYTPEATEGQKLLAHELTHVLQQTGGARLGKSAEGGQVPRLGIVETYGGRMSRIMRQALPQNQQPKGKKNKSAIQFPRPLNDDGKKYEGKSEKEIVDQAESGRKLLLYLALSRLLLFWTKADKLLTKHLSLFTVISSKSGRQQQAALRTMVPEAMAHLQDIAEHVSTIKRIGMLAVRAPSARNRALAHKSLNQGNIGIFLQRARSVYEALQMLPANDREKLRRAYMQVLEEIPKAARTALDVASGMSPPIGEKEQRRYNENMKLWAEARVHVVTGAKLRKIGAELREIDRSDLVRAMEAFMSTRLADDESLYHPLNQTFLFSVLRLILMIGGNLSQQCSHTHGGPGGGRKPPYARAEGSNIVIFTEFFTAPDILQAVIMIHEYFHVIPMPFAQYPGKGGELQHPVYEMYPGSREYPDIHHERKGGLPLHERSLREAFCLTGLVCCLVDGSSKVLELIRDEMLEGCMEEI